MRQRRAALAGIFRRRQRKPVALLADESGATAIEFAIIAVPFTGVLFAILEMSLFLFANQALDTALDNAARKIMTGQVQNGGFNAAQFKGDVCSLMPALIDCSKLQIDVQSYPSAAPAPNKPITNGSFDPSGFGFHPGGPSCIVVARAALEYPLYVTLLLAKSSTTELDSGARVMMSTVSFRNEPYVTSGPPPTC